MTYELDEMAQYSCNTVVLFPVRQPAGAWKLPHQVGEGQAYKTVPLYTALDFYSSEDSPLTLSAIYIKFEASE